jgi:RimJ/RimL family protein N-acetyltransferase
MTIANEDGGTMIHSSIGNLEGRWVRLEPVTEQLNADIGALDRKSEVLPQMGGIIQRQIHSDVFGAPIMVIRVRSTNIAAGIIANRALKDHKGVCSVWFYTDRTVIRPGFAVEAFSLYINYLFQMRAEKIYMEILEFNTPVIKFLHRCGLSLLVRTRKSYYIAGHFWDTVIFAFDQVEWETVRERSRIFLPR